MPQYLRNPPLHERELASDPLIQFESWLKDAAAAGMIEPTAMTLATVSRDGRPHARVVLFKGLERGGFSFYTNYGSAKGRELSARSRAALVFWWDKLERQIRVEGKVEKLPRAKALAYFHSRPRISQISASISAQSQVVASRTELESRYRAVEARLEGKPVPLPKSWGGYRVLPESIEFWQGQPGRLHDRLRYRRSGKRWTLERLEP